MGIIISFLEKKYLFRYSKIIYPDLKNKNKILFDDFYLETVYNEDDTLWCYECNTNLKKERTQECNDPYAGRSGDLIQCSQNGSQQCLKSIITCKL